MMKYIAPIAVAWAALLTAPALADHRAGHQTPPGQDRACLVTTGTPGSFNDADVVETKWLPRRAAEAQASRDPDRMRVFDYSDNALVTGGTYASAEELCKTHFN
jgi:hypothetical protein